MPRTPSAVPTVSQPSSHSAAASSVVNPALKRNTSESRPKRPVAWSSTVTAPLNAVAGTPSTASQMSVASRGRCSEAPIGPAASSPTRAAVASASTIRTQKKA